MSKDQASYGGIVSSTKQKTCGTCKDWNFKTSTGKKWGQCKNPKKQDFCYISVRDFPNRLENTDDIHQFQKDVSECCEVYFEENNFGCIHHMKNQTQILPKVCLDENCPVVVFGRQLLIDFVQNGAKLETALKHIFDAIKLAQETSANLSMTPVIWKAIEDAQELIK